MKKLAIVGAQELTRGNAPWNDDEYEIWTIAHHAKADWCKRFDAVIEVHERSFYTSGYKDPEYFEWLKTIEQTVYMIDVHTEVKGAKKYPLAEVKEKLLPNIKLNGEPINNFCSTADYAIALAVYLGYEEIDIYGIEMAHSSEYQNQQSSFTFWVGIAVANGVQVNLNCTSGLFDKPLYGREDITAVRVRDYIAGMNQQSATLDEQQKLLKGALQFANQLLQDEILQTLY